MKYIFTLLFTFLTFSIADAQGERFKPTSPVRLDTARFKNLEKQLKAQQQVLNKQKAALDSLGKVNLVLTAHKDGYSNNIAVLTWVFGALLTVAVFYFGYLVPKDTKKQ